MGHLKALILIHNTSKKKWCLPPVWTSQPACRRDRPPSRREKLFFQARPGAGRGSLSQARGVGWVGSKVVSGPRPIRAKIATAQLFKIRNSISFIGIVNKFGCYSEIHNWP